MVITRDMLAIQSEEYLLQQGVQNPVAIFAQATAGDVSATFSWSETKYNSAVESKILCLKALKIQLLGKPLDFTPSFVDPLIAEMNRQVKAGAIQTSPLVPSVIPLQIIHIGALALVCCPGEITTTAGQRLIQTVAKQLTTHQMISTTALVSYCNDYMGYITTQEEYKPIDIKNTRHTDEDIQPRKLSWPSEDALLTICCGLTKSFPALNPKLQKLLGVFVKPTTIRRLVQSNFPTPNAKQSLMRWNIRFQIGVWVWNVLEAVLTG
ncbi:hypothetical protein FQR65_LT17104 [Abscondita terminalis]|nr:hypothetical protein FQR65_LT17104 [Abscondita terminalis]